MSVTWSIRAVSRPDPPLASPSRVLSAPASQLVAELARLLREPRQPLLALELTQAAATLGVSKAFLDRHVRHELRVVRRGRKVLVPVRELERWLEDSAALTLESQP